MSGNNFFAQVYNIVRQIPRGKVVTYGHIAAMLGNPRASRQVGYAMRVCPDDAPWQRVVMKDGRLVGCAHAEMRRAILESEGVIIDDAGYVDMATCQWKP